ncbi:CU044_2847 family protein [Streptomyces xinghaiensis]|uniref:CU044_2847 family protein n=1 Tax=Streptomyces xinghaiensis TaxID=1038928 RepID=UPI0037B6D7DA
MPDYLELELADGAAVRLELTGAGGPPADAPERTGDRPDLPEGFGTPTPVARGGRTGRPAAEALRSVLRPLGPLLQEIHASIAGSADPPQEVTVEFGVQMGQDLKLGIVGVRGQSTMTVSATWRHDSPRM